MFNQTSLDSQLGHPRILVLGDAMLDRYTWGTADRVSPEAPVLVLRTDEKEVRLGGAASVATLLRALQAEVALAAVIGNDHDGRTIQRLLQESGIDAGPLLVDSDRPTTTKERFLGRSEHRQPHQILRVDTESHEPINDDLAEKLVESVTVAFDSSAGRARFHPSRESPCGTASESSPTQCLRSFQEPFEIGVGRTHWLESPSLRTGLADFPHPALRLMVYLRED